MTPNERRTLELVENVRNTTTRLNNARTVREANEIRQKKLAEVVKTAKVDYFNATEALETHLYPDGRPETNYSDR